MKQKKNYDTYLDNIAIYQSSLLNEIASHLEVSQIVNFGEKDQVLFVRNDDPAYKKAKEHYKKVKQFRNASNKSIKRLKKSIAVSEAQEKKILKDMKILRKEYQETVITKKAKMHHLKRMEKGFFFYNIIFYFNKTANFRNISMILIFTSKTSQGPS